jgi:hypothetical protein
MNKKEDLDSYKIEDTHFVSSLNKAVELLEESPLSTKKLTQVKYPKEEFRKVKGAVKRKIFNLTASSGSIISGEGEMIAQLKEKFHITGKRSEKAQILAILPESWSVRKISNKNSKP